MENKGFKFFKKGSAFLIAPALSSSFLPGMSANTVGGNVASKAASESAISKFGAGAVKFLGNHWVGLALLVSAGLLAWYLWPSDESEGTSDLGEKVNDENRLATIKEFEEIFWHLFNVKDKMSDMNAAKAPFDFFATPEKDEESGGKLVPQSMVLGNEIILFVRKDKDGEDSFSNGEPSKKGLYSVTNKQNDNAWVSLTIGYLKDFEKRAKEHLKGLLKNPNDWYEIEKNASNEPPEPENAGDNENFVEEKSNIEQFSQGSNLVISDEMRESKLKNKDFEINTNNNLINNDIVDRKKKTFKEEFEASSKERRGGNLDTDKRILQKFAFTFKYEGWVSNDDYRLIHIFDVGINFCFSPDNPTLFFEVSKKKKNGDIVIRKAYDLEKGLCYDLDHIVPVCFKKNFVTDNKKIKDEAIDVLSIREDYYLLCLLRACSMDLEQYDENFWKSCSNNYNPQMPPNYGMPMQGNNQGFNNMPVNSSNMGNNNMMNNINGNNQNPPYNQGVGINGFQWNNDGNQQQMMANIPQIPQGQQGQNFPQQGYDNNNNGNNFNNNMMPPQQQFYGNGNNNY